jgi:hypothetical protein
MHFLLALLACFGNSLNASAGICTTATTTPDDRVYEFVSQVDQASIISDLDAFVSNPKKFLGWRTDAEKSSLEFAADFAAFVLQHQDHFLFVRLSWRQQKEILKQYFNDVGERRTDLLSWLLQRSYGSVQTMHSRTGSYIIPSIGLKYGPRNVRQEYLKEELSRVHAFAVASPGVSPDGSIIVALPKPFPKHLQ